MENLSRNTAMSKLDTQLSKLRAIALALCCCVSLTVAAAPHQSHDSTEALDKQITTTLALLAAGDIRQARVLARQMANRFPKYALAQLLSAELESAAAFQDVKAADINPISKGLIDLLSEAQIRSSSAQQREVDIRANASAGLSPLPNAVIQMGKHVSDLLIVDLEDSYIKHITGDDKSPSLIRQHYIASGKGGYGKQSEGDNKTPLGVYAITGKRPDSSLPSLYGSGALTLNYPNALDKHLGRTGYGIWIHGVPHAQQSRAPRSSEGCVTMSNDHITALMGKVTPSKTLVILAQGLGYETDTTRAERQRQFQDLFTTYQHTLLTGTKADIAAMYESTNRSRTLLHPMSLIRELADIHSQDITMIMNPELPPEHQTVKSKILVMKGRFGPENEHQITLFWREQADGKWLIFTEARSSPKS